MVAENAVRGKGVVAALVNLLVARSAQDGHDVRDAERLARAHDARDDLLRDDQRVRHRLVRVETDVARAAVGVVVRLAEVLDQRLVAAGERGRVLLHAVDVLDRGRVGGAGEDRVPRRGILRRVEHRAFRFEAVAARAAGLLLVMLDRLGHGRVQHEADVGAVDAHAEGDRGNDQVALLRGEGLLGLLPLFGR